MYTEPQNPSSRSPINSPVNEDVQSAINATAPGQLRVIKRNGKVVPYDDSKIVVAMTKAFLAVEGGTAAASRRIHETVRNLCDQISQTFKRRMPSGGTIHIEDIQDQVELALMRSGEHKVARDYVIYRDQRARLREEKVAKAKADAQKYPQLEVVCEDGSRKPLDLVRIRTVIEEACESLADVSAEEIMDQAMRNLYNGVAQKEVSTSLVITARTMIEQEPNYSLVASRLLLDTLREEALTFLGVSEQATQSEMSAFYPRALEAFIKKRSRARADTPQYAGLQLGAAWPGNKHRSRPSIQLPGVTNPL